MLTLLLAASCEKDTAQIVQEIDAAREGCTEEMLKAGAEECVQMFEKYIDMGTGAIETYIGAVRAFDAASDRGPAVRFDTTGLGQAISPVFLDRQAHASGALPLGNLESLAEQKASYAEESLGSPGASREVPSYRPSYIEPEAGGDAGIPSAKGVERGYDSRRLAPTQQQTPRRGAILPPAERLNRPWIGDASRQEDYYPDAASWREPARPRPEDPEASRREPSERPPL